jgi:hypothetical protein
MDDLSPLDALSNHSCLSLRDLSLHYVGHSSISQKALAANCQSSLHLCTLVLILNRGPSDFEEVLSQLHNLQELRLGYTCDWTVVGELAKVIRKCPNIRSIVVK